jgi:peptide chain release factor 1
MEIEQAVTQRLRRLEEVEGRLAQGLSYGDPAYLELAQEHKRLTEIRESWDEIQQLHVRLEETRQMARDERDPELAQLVREELETLEKRLVQLQQQLQRQILPPDPNADRTTMLELRAGAGGEEAALFVADCVRMYQHYAASKGWKVERLSATASDMGGLKEYVMVVSGPEVYRHLKHEAGTHRVQRVPETEAQGRIHTSTITVAVLLEPVEQEVVIDEKELRIDTYRASGAGGQHVNVTDSAVRITHLPTGVVVACQDERSQHKNKDKAMRVLRARLAEEQQRKAQAAMSQARLSQVGTGDRSERIRTYNFPQNRVTDHRIGVTLHQLTAMLEGDLDELIQALILDEERQRQEALA